ncbi:MULTISPECIES: fimbrial protein [Citrobacter freundii complex]|uniref:fimbrial protein n=1 Tax=Citrobacter freundii complex TaxID=1344959 RepID=UPI0002B8A3B6|nr:fimbrial protein [Citrobacter freundii]EKW1723412.1 type 1 fimbrial protein [Citrobacter freundii]ELS0843173.1 type 1 fimbrial protein [Citrobacter freundii]EMF22090.1 P pilus assembly protein, pilin FimA [Citrobacter freundii GTC 09479]MBJ8799642.1 type 1 fimbrial protein [Citrobacter freundii]MBJ9179751.1 type 1 fimbrial protein [Citrobacter freundii]
MHNSIFYLLMLLISTPALAAESWVEAPAMTLTVKATAVTSACNIRVAEGLITLPGADIRLFESGGIYHSLGPMDYGSDDNIYTPFDITLSGCGSESAAIQRTMRLTFSDSTGVAPLLPGVFVDQPSAGIGIVIFDINDSAYIRNRNVLLSNIYFLGVMTDDEQTFHYAARYQYIAGGTQEARPISAAVIVSAAYE